MPTAINWVNVRGFYCCSRCGMPCYEHDMQVHEAWHNTLDEWQKMMQLMGREMANEIAKLSVAILKMSAGLAAVGSIVKPAEVNRGGGPEGEKG